MIHFYINFKILEILKTDADSSKDEVNEAEQLEGSGKLEVEDSNIESVDIQSQEGAKSKLEDKDLPERKNRPGSTSKKQKKTKLGKSLEVLTEGFLRLEELRHKREMDYQIKMKELDNERRREERKHELAIFHLLPQARVPQQQHGQQREFGFPQGSWNHYQGTSGLHFGTSSRGDSNSTASSSYEDENSDYYQL